MRKWEEATRIDAKVEVDFDELQKALGIDKIKSVEVHYSVSDNLSSKLIIKTVRMEK